MLGTDWIDVYQFHNPRRCPLPGDGSGLYEAMVEARERGLIRFIGITNHRLDTARQAVASGLYDTLQFPFSSLSGEQELSLVRACASAQVGFIAMKALSGGLITHARAAYAYLRQFPNVLPIWGIQKMEELEEWLEFMDETPVYDEELRAYVEQEKKELSGDFCRGCGYCMPCPADIMINNCARMSLMLRRSPSKAWLTEEMQAEMAKIENCLNCRQCVSKCPYELNTPELLRKNLEDYKKVLAGEVKVQ